MLSKCILQPGLQSSQRALLLPTSPQQASRQHQMRDTCRGTFSYAHRITVRDEHSSCLLVNSCKQRRFWTRHLSNRKLAIERINPTSGALEGPPRYCQVVKHRGIAYIAGQTATDFSEGAATSYEAQTIQVLQHLEEQLAAAGSSKANLLSVRVFLKDMRAGVLIFNELWLRWLGPEATAALPARTTIQADLVSPDLLVEVDAVAAVPAAAVARTPVEGAASALAAAGAGLRARAPARGEWWRPGTWATAAADFVTNGYVLTFAFLAAVTAVRVRQR